MSGGPRPIPLDPLAILHIKDFDGSSLDFDGCIWYVIFSWIMLIFFILQMGESNLQIW